MLAAIDRIGRYTAGLTAEQFAKDEKTIEAVCFALIVLGEAATHIPESVQSTAPGIPWRKVRGMRNIAAHEYFGLDVQAVWQTATTDVAALRPLLQALVAACP
jgi:uncharacterized protein with HEPN domain